MRIPYVPDPPLTANDQETAILERIKARRGHLGLGAVDRALLHAPAVADGWYVYELALTYSPLPPLNLSVWVPRTNSDIDCHLGAILMTLESCGLT